MLDLFKYQDLEYQKFHKKLLNNDKINVIGIRTPIMKEIAKNMAKNEYLEYINSKHTYYDEIVIHGFILGYIKVPFKQLLKYLDDFIPLVDNWATNDMVCANLKAFKKNQNEGFKYIDKLLQGNNYSKRFGLVLLLDHYLNDEYIDRVLDICLNIKDNDYYVMMANSWLLSICFIKYKDKTYKILINNNLDKMVLNKAISKICDSLRVTKDDKEEIKKLRK